MKKFLAQHSLAGAAAALALLVYTAGTPTTAWSARGDCGQPITNGSSPASTDCLFILNVALGLEACNPECICELNNAAPVTSTDALVCLNVAIGNPPPFFPSCPCDPSTSTTSSTILTTTTSSTSTTSTTTSSTTTTTVPLPTGCGEADVPTCDGACPNADDACLPGEFGCQCMPMGCGGYMGAPMCYGLCPPEEQCVDIDGGCLCEPGQQGCNSASAPQCDGSCPDGAFCIQTGEACDCAPVTCGQFAPAPTCLGSCPLGGQICVSNGQSCECQTPER